MSDETVWLTKRKGTKKGKAIIRYSLRWLDVTTGRWRSKAAGTDSKLAQRLAADLENKLAAGTFQDVKHVGWGEFVRHHVSTIEGKAHAAITRRTLARFGEVTGAAGVHRVSYPMIEAFVAHLRSKGNSPATIAKHLRYVRRALRQAVKRGMLGRNPFDSDLFPTVEDKIPRILTDNEETKLRKAAEGLYGFRWEAFIITALNTGARRTELLTLSWNRVELDHSPSVTFVKTKGRKDRRIPLTDETIVVLRRLQAMTLQAGGPFIGMGKKLSSEWNTIAIKAGVEDVKPHDLRRTFCARLIRTGTPLPTVQKLAGHSAIATTLRYYNWVSDDDLRQGIAKLNHREVG